MSSIQFLQSSPIEVADLVDKKIETRLNAFMDQLSNKQADDDLLTTDQACSLLKIDQSTIWRWGKAKKIKVYAICGKRYYKRSEIMDSLIELKK